MEATAAELVAAMFGYASSHSVVCVPGTHCYAARRLDKYVTRLVSTSRLRALAHGSLSRMRETLSAVLVRLTSQELVIVSQSSLRKITFWNAASFSWPFSDIFRSPSLSCLAELPVLWNGDSRCLVEEGCFSHEHSFDG